MTTTSFISCHVPVDISHKDWRRLLCTVSLRAHYGTMEAAARAMGITKQTLYAVIRGALHSERIESQLADLVGQPLAVLFPQQAA